MRDINCLFDAITDLSVLAAAATNPRLLDCITSWLREIPAAQVIDSPLMDVIIKALDNDSSFDAGVDCMCTLYRDTKDVHESLPIIQALYPRLMALRPKIAETAETEDLEAFKGITRMFAEAGEAWVVLIARMPAEFRGLVEAILECCARDWEREAISITFIFWYELKQSLTIERRSGLTHDGGPDGKGDKQLAVLPFFHVYVGPHWPCL